MARQETKAGLRRERDAARDAERAAKRDLQRETFAKNKVEGERKALADENDELRDKLIYLERSLARAEGQLDGMREALLPPPKNTAQEIETAHFDYGNAGFGRRSPEWYDRRR